MVAARILGNLLHRLKVPITRHPIQSFPRFPGEELTFGQIGNDPLSHKHKHKQLSVFGKKKFTIYQKVYKYFIISRYHLYVYFSEIFVLSFVLKVDSSYKFRFLFSRLLYLFSSLISDEMVGISASRSIFF